MGRYAFLFVCLVGIVCSGTAIVTSQEQNALSKILAAFPSLATVTVFDRYPSNGEMDYGAPWTTDFSQLCSGSDGWQFFGVRCANGHIDKIRFTNGWGNFVGGSTFDITGLEYLAEYESADVEDVFVSGEIDLVKAILQSTRVVKMTVGPTAPFEMIGASTSLKILIASVLPTSSKASFLEGSIIEELTIRSLGLMPLDMMDFENVTATLKKFELAGYAASSLLIAPSLNFPVLETLTLLFSTSETELHWIASPSLKSLTLGIYDSPTLQTIEVSAGPNLEELGIISPEATNLTLNTGTSLRSLKIECRYLERLTSSPMPNLESLHLMQWTHPIFPFSFSSLPSISTFIFDSTNQDAYVGLVSMGLQDLHQLKSFSLRGVSTNDEQFQGLLCSIPNNNGMFRSLLITFASQSVTLNIPSCLRSQKITEMAMNQAPITLSSLAHLPPTLALFSIRSCSVTVSSSQEWLNFANAVPNLDSLLMADISGISGPLPFSALLRLRQLRVLSMARSSLTGTIPPAFFSEMPSLQNVNFGTNQLSGTVPWYGLQNLAILVLSNNPFTDWPGIVGDGEYKMRKIDLSRCELATIPSDSHFSKLTQLQTLDLGDNYPYLTGPTPAFWKNSPRIWQLRFDNNLFSGTFPSPINAPRLKELSATNNQLCGSLPSFQNVAVEGLQLSLNRFSGSIPNDWATQFSPSTILNLADNILNGSLPDGWYGTGALRKQFLLQLSRNDFTGPMFDLAHMPPESAFWVSNTLISPCQKDPNVNDENTRQCFFSYMQAGQSVCECPLYYLCVDESSFCPDFTLATPPPERDYTCQVEQPRETPPGLPSAPVCPQPIPINFVCRNGTWVAITTAPVITIPPNSGTIQISGNFTAETVVFDGLGTSINITGCAYIDEEIVIELEEAVKEGEPPILLIQQSDGCPIPLNSLTVSLNQQQSNSCKKIKATTEGSTATTLVVAFKIDSSGCNTKWIILGSVLGAVVVIGVIVAILVFTLNSKARDCIRPYSSRGGKKIN